MQDNELGDPMWYLTLHRWTGGRTSAGREAIAEHLTWMREQQRAGKVLIAGPTPDHELGIIVFGHMPEAELHELCRTEPLIAAGLRTYDAHPWEVHHLLGIGGFDLETVAAMARAEHA
jgi:uncharacterized protein YciI